MFACDIQDLVELHSWYADVPGSGFKNAAGVLTDPTTVTLKVEKPNGTETTYTYAAAEVLKDSAGRFYRRLDPDMSGTWHYKFIGTGTVETAIEGAFFVRESRF